MPVYLPVDTEEAIIQSFLVSSQIWGIHLSIDKNDERLILASDAAGHGYCFMKSKISERDIQQISNYRKSRCSTSITLIESEANIRRNQIFQDEVCKLQVEVVMRIVLPPDFGRNVLPADMIFKIVSNGGMDLIAQLKEIESAPFNLLPYLSSRKIDGCSDCCIAFAKSKPVALLVFRKLIDHIFIDWIQLFPTAVDGLPICLIDYLLQHASNNGCQLVFARAPNQAVSYFEESGFELVEQLCLCEFGNCRIDPHLEPTADVAGSSVLRSKQECDYSYRILDFLRLPKHHDYFKNWDSSAALNIILKHLGTNRGNKTILDAGGEYYSSILPLLEASGFTNLICINLTFRKTTQIGQIVYEQGDITGTRFVNETFDAVVCQSVIEHGVDPPGYFKEMYRILKPEGLLIISTDYWVDPVDTRQKSAFGVPVKIFDKSGIEEIVDEARNAGFSLLESLDLKCEEKVINWNELDYTFLYFTLRKTFKE